MDKVYAGKKQEVHLAGQWILPNYIFLSLILHIMRHDPDEEKYYGLKYEVFPKSSSVNTGMFKGEIIRL